MNLRSNEKETGTSQNKMQNQDFPLKLTHDSYNHRGHRPLSLI
jgi:hypothetical protein